MVQILDQQDLPVVVKIQKHPHHLQLHQLKEEEVGRHQPVSRVNRDLIHFRVREWGKDIKTIGDMLQENIFKKIATHTTIAHREEIPEEAIKQALHTQMQPEVILRFLSLVHRQPASAVVGIKLQADQGVVTNHHSFYGTNL